MTISAHPDSLPTRATFIHVAGRLVEQNDLRKALEADDTDRDYVSRLDQQGAALDTLLELTADAAIMLGLEWTNEEAAGELTDWLIAADTGLAWIYDDSFPARYVVPGLGSRVKACWGAMFPTHEGTIIEGDPAAGFKIQWDEWCDLEPSWHHVSTSRPRSPNGSPIGVWLDLRPRAEPEADDSLLRQREAGQLDG
ncbi:MAG TPA: hypothetical protein VFE72_02895 [Lysobacter sp.]|nr:hypothetical protein [Lysobacter sp.]